MHYRIGTALVFITLFSLSNISSSTAAVWQWIKPQRVHSLVKEGSGLWLVDVRSEPTFVESHVEGAINIPSGLIEARRLPQGKIIVIVDDSLGLKDGRHVADELLKKGHVKIFLLEGGMRAWRVEGYPVAGAGSGAAYLSVSPADVDWALDNHIPMKIYDLRGKDQQQEGKVRQALVVEGKDLNDRLGKVRKMITDEPRKGISAKLGKQETIILIFPIGSEPERILQRSFQGVEGDIRFLRGGVAAWAAKPRKDITSTVGACPTCPGGGAGGK